MLFADYITLPKGTQLVSGEAGIQSLAVWLQSHAFHHCAFRPSGQLAHERNQSWYISVHCKTGC